MNPTKTLKREVATYLVIAYALCTAIAVALPHADINAMLAVLVPVLTVAILTFTITPRGERKALWRKIGLGCVEARTWSSAILIPIALCAGAYGAAIALGVGRLQIDLGQANLGWAINLLMSAVLGTVFILGEEIGWRGYLLPRMQQLVPDKRRAALLTGFAHGCFHLPLILIGTTYDNEVPGWVAAPAAVALITAGGVFYAWVWDRSNSVWPVAIAHNTVNTVFDLGAAGVVATGGVKIAYVAGETGVATLAVVVVTAALLWRYAKVWHTPAAPSVPNSERRPVSAAAA
jgi:membrane protease YdiL (CAAX protease family)